MGITDKSIREDTISKKTLLSSQIVTDFCSYNQSEFYIEIGLCKELCEVCNQDQVAFRQIRHNKCTIFLLLELLGLNAMV